MATGCQGPFCHGTGGWCGCNCKCCPPPCCPVVSVRFQCVENPPCPPCPLADLPDTLCIEIMEPESGCLCGGGVGNLTRVPGTNIWTGTIPNTNGTDTCNWPDLNATFSFCECNPADPDTDTFSLVVDNLGCSSPETVAAEPVLSCGNDPFEAIFDVNFDCVGADCDGAVMIKVYECPIGLLALPGPPQPMPKFDKKTIMSKNRRFLFGGPFPTSTSLPIQPVCVPLVPGGGSAMFGGLFGDPLPGVCCFEIIDGQIIAVGNGYVNAPASITADNGCEAYTVLLNGQTPPVWVNDCEPITVTVTPDDSCCVCEFIDIQCGPCDGMGMLYAPSNRLWKKVVSNTNKKVKINPKTGLPYIYIDKTELLRRVVARRQHLRRRKQ